MNAQAIKTTEASWIGWHRAAGRRQRWRPVVEGDTEEMAFRRLLDAVAGGDKCVLPRGDDPNGTRTRGK